ncbi:unnamed protein product [Parnassius apollo]|uniref:(apollo) hypothetical protein n=1 Tax=Parnassius apollo TaxID=110799 RepID=A0A8S3YB07_PARAO|nr:unnamed protein product [Parnassius apollo]
MDESGIDMGFDLASFLTNDNHVDHILDEMTAAQHQDFMYYELKSKAVPVTERTRASPHNDAHGDRLNPATSMRGLPGPVRARLKTFPLRRFALQTGTLARLRDAP